MDDFRLTLAIVVFTAFGLMANWFAAVILIGNGMAIDFVLMIIAEILIGVWVCILLDFLLDCAPEFLVGITIVSAIVWALGLLALIIAAVVLI